MKIYPEELLAAQQYQQTRAVPTFSDSQLREIRAIGKRYVQWMAEHTHLHNLINCVLLAFLFSADMLVVWKLPEFFSAAASPLRLGLTIAVVSLLHGYISYGVIVFSMHEGAAHDRIIQRTGPLTRFLAWLANNACRLFFADPIYYRSRHLHHHKDFGTSEDGAFTNFVHPRRFWLSLLPMAGLLDFNDYKIHCDVTWSSSRWYSLATGAAYIVFLGIPAAISFGTLYAVSVLIFLGPWTAFVLDRLRETTEHNLMALNTPGGARELGCGFWGLVIGGGPWGQPCHLSHHLIPALPWYQQCLLHGHLVRIMTREQRQFFTIRPVIGFPALLLRVLAENHRWIPIWKVRERNESP